MTASSRRFGSLVLIALAFGACKKKEAPVPDAAVPDAAPVVLEVQDAAPQADAALAALVVDAAAPAAAGPLALPGKCVDPMADAKTRGTGPGPVVSSTPDLDGDGKPDKILTFGIGGTVKPFIAYVMRGTCGHEVATFSVGSLLAAKTKSHGLLDLNGNIPCAKKCNCSTQDFTARFNGKAYFQGRITENFLQCAPHQKP